MKQLIPILALLILSTSSLRSQENSELLKCWIEAYGQSFDFYTELDKLESDLITLKILPEDNTGEDYITLLDEVRADLKPKVLEQIDITRYKYVSETVFRSCIAPMGILEKEGKTLKYGMLLSIYVIVARHQHAMVHLEIVEQSKLKLEGKEITLEDLEKEFNSAARKLQDKGVVKEEIWLSMSVHPETKMGIVIDIQMAIRQAGIRKVNYINFK